MNLFSLIDNFLEVSYQKQRRTIKMKLIVIFAVIVAIIAAFATVPTEALKKCPSCSCKKIDHPPYCEENPVQCKIGCPDGLTD